MRTVIITRYRSVSPAALLMASTAGQLAKRDGYHCPDRMERIAMDTLGRGLLVTEAFQCMRAAKAVL